jgi:hypothetical protein
MLCLIKKGFEVLEGELNTFWNASFSYSNGDELQIKTVIDHDLKELDEWSKK